MLPKPEKDAFFVQEIKKSLFQTMKDKNRKEKVSFLETLKLVRLKFRPCRLKENQNPENQNGRRATIFNEGALWKNGFGMKKGVCFEDEFREDLNFNSDFGSKVTFGEKKRMRVARHLRNETIAQQDICVIRTFA